jgi:hypothetical protein
MRCLEPGTWTARCPGASAWEAREHGMPRQYTRIPLAERFWANIDRSGGPDACWIWVGPKYSTGYGRVWDGTTLRLAHRVAYEQAHGAGSIPPTSDVLHNCLSGPDRKDCVNPAHLWLGTQADNARDAVEKRQITFHTGFDHPSFGTRRLFCLKGHEMTPENVVWTNRGKVRRCRICYTASSRAGALRYLAAHRDEINARKRERRAQTRTGPARGERHGLTTLSENDVRAIRVRSSTTTLAALARCYNVLSATIANIVHLRTWKHVP